MSKSTDSETLGVHCPRELIELIEKRAKMVNMTKSGYAALILKYWADKNCPPVSDLDRKMRAFENLTVPTEKPAKATNIPASRSKSIKLKKNI